MFTEDREYGIVDLVQDLLHNSGLELAPSTLLITLLVAVSPLLLLLGLALTQGDAHLPPPAGCRKLARKGRSNLEDQYSKKYAKGGEATPAKPWSIKALFVYPLKSCAGVELEKGEIIRTGLKYDREFTFAQQVTSLPSLDGKVTSEWHFMTLRKFPRLAMVEPEIWVPDPSAKDYREDGEWIKSEGCIVVRFPFSPDTDFSLQGALNYGKLLAARLAKKSEPMLEFRVPFNPTKERAKSKGYRNEILKIIKDSPMALNMGSEIDPETLAKLRYTLGAANPITLFRIDPSAYREVFRNAPKKQDVGFQTVIGLQDDVSCKFSLCDVHTYIGPGKEKLRHEQVPYSHTKPLKSIPSTFSTSPQSTTSPPASTRRSKLSTSGKTNSRSSTPCASAQTSTSQAPPPSTKTRGPKRALPRPKLLANQSPLSCTCHAAQRAASCPMWTLRRGLRIGMSR